MNTIIDTTDKTTDEALFDCWLHGKDEAFQLLEARHRRGVEYFVNHFLARLAPIHLPATTKLVTEVFRRCCAAGKGASFAVRGGQLSGCVMGREMQCCAL